MILFFLVILFFVLLLMIGAMIFVFFLDSIKWFMKTKKEEPEPDFTNIVLVEIKRSKK